jgi:F-type H+-transporting ATPase subunit b
MPQFDFANPIVWAQLAWLGLAFLILYFGIVQLTLPKLVKTLDARESQVAADIATAERAKSDADRMAQVYANSIEEAHNLARASITEAKAKAAVSVEKAVAAGNAVIAEKAAAADASLSKARKKALGEIESVASDAASDIVERLTGKRPDSKTMAIAAKSALAA